MVSDRPTYEDENGYLRFSDNHQLVHRAVAELKIGRRLMLSEVVHHIDMDKQNNDPANLRVCDNQDEHEKLHGGVYSKKDRSLSAFLIIVYALVLSAALLCVLWIALFAYASSNAYSLVCALPPAILAIIIMKSLDRSGRN